MRTIIVGDLHGCLDELVELIQVVDLRMDDTLVLAGDLVDRGPASLGTVRFLRKLSDRFNVVVVRGNHENKHLSGKELGGEEGRINRALEPEDLEFLSRSILYHRIPEHQAIVVHGGIGPKIRELPEDPSVIRGWSSKDRKNMTQLMYLRYITDHATNTELFWAWQYDGRFGHVFFGHQPFMQPEAVKFPHATGLDLGCCFGGHLCAAILEPGQPVRYEVVRAREEYFPRRAV